MPEVLESYSVTSEQGYLLRIVALDLAAFARFMSEKLVHLPGVRGVKPSIVLSSTKRTSVSASHHADRIVAALAAKISPFSPRQSRPASIACGPVIVLLHRAADARRPQRRVAEKSVRQLHFGDDSGECEATAGTSARERV